MSEQNASSTQETITAQETARKQELAKNALKRTWDEIVTDEKDAWAHAAWPISVKLSASAPTRVMRDEAAKAGVDLDNLDAAPAETDWQALARTIKYALQDDYDESAEYDSEPGCNGNGNGCGSAAWALSCYMTDWNHKE